MDRDKRKWTTSKILSVVGCMLLLLPVGFEMYWGNASIYVLSFMASRLEPVDEFLISTSIPLYMATYGAVVLVCGYLLRRVSRGTMVLLGFMCCNASLFLSYFSVQQSMLLLNLTTGGLLGIGSGIMDSCAINIALGHAHGDEGILSALLLACCSLGGLVNCQINTWYVNPKNENPNLKIGSFTIFTNKDIIDRVPSMFLFLGCFMFISQALGMLMLLVSSRAISDTKPSEENWELMHLKTQCTTPEKIGKKAQGSTADEQHKTPNVSKGLNQKTPRSANYDEHQNTPKSRQNLNKKTPGSTNDEHYQHTPNVSKELNQKTPGSTNDEHQQNTPKVRQNLNQPTSELELTHLGDVGMDTRSRSRGADPPKSSGNDSTPSEMLSHPAFYACWLSLFTSQISFNVATNFYKLFGLQWIPDDQFLGIIGALSTPSVTLCRLLCGAALDRFGPKMSIIGFQMAIVVFGAWFVFTPMVSRWLYMFFTLVFISVNGTMLVGTCGIIARIFGKTHISTNVGYLFTSAIAANILVPFVVDFLRQFGWCTLFAGTSGMNILSICFCLKYLSSATR